MDRLTQQFAKRRQDDDEDDDDHDKDVVVIKPSSTNTICNYSNKNIDPLIPDKILIY